MDKSIKLSNNTYLDAKGIKYRDDIVLDDMLSGRWVANIDNVFLPGCYTSNPNTEGTFPGSNKYGQLICFSNYNSYTEGFSLLTQIFIPTWGTASFIRTHTNDSIWTNWNKIITQEDITWKKATFNNDTKTITVPISWDNLKEITFRSLGFNTYFGYVTVIKELWHNNGEYNIIVNDFDFNGVHEGSAEFRVTAKNADNFVISVAFNGNANNGSIECYYR